jgi:two-component system phosphate regulon sensor histidine kinase PhoR
VENIRLKHQDADIKFTSAIPGRKINADVFHFSNLVYNLLDNSIKYSTGVPHINLEVKEDQKNIIFSVSDKGVGIPKSNLENIFDKFYRIPGKKLNEVSGFGLGLFYVKKICDAHKWKISAISEPDTGTTILILIPKEYA